MSVDANTVVLSQTTDETRRLEIKVLLDSGSQKTYVSDEANNFLQLDPISNQSVTTKNRSIPMICSDSRWV